MQILSIGKMGARQKKTPAVWFPLALSLSPSRPNTQKEELTCNYSLHPVGRFVNRQFSHTTNPATLGVPQHHLPVFLWRGQVYQRQRLSGGMHK